MIRDLAQKLVGDSLLTVLERRGDPVGLAERDFSRRRQPQEARPRVDLMIGVLLEQISAATHAKRDDGSCLAEVAQRDHEVEAAAAQLLQLLTSPPHSGPYDWLMALAMLRLSALRNKGDGVLDWFENDNFNVVVAEGLLSHLRKVAAQV